MKKFKIQSELLGDDEKKMFDGVIEINVPARKERLQFLKERLDLGKKFEKDSSEKLEGQFDFLDSVFNACFVSIDLTHVVSGEKIKTKEDLEFFAEGQSLINEIATVCINGIELGKVQN